LDGTEAVRAGVRGTAIGPGSRVGSYLLMEQVGRGGMALVFLALDERLHRQVAIKVMAPGLPPDDGFRQRFIRELRAAAAVDDPHIIPVFDAGEADGVLYIAMRHVPGGDLRSMIQRDGPLSAGRTAMIVRAVASALDAAHSAGLLHRDVKPANMLVDARPGRQEHVYLSDFGLSKAVSQATGLTGSGQFLGTLDYIAPEQIEGGLVDGRTDQYALACSAYELLTAAPPFPREGAPAVMYAHLSEAPPSVRSRRPDIPAGVDQVLATALAKTPDKRYRTCSEFADALATALSSAADSPPGPGRPPDRPPTEVVPHPQPARAMSSRDAPTRSALRQTAPRTGSPVPPTGEPGPRGSAGRRFGSRTLATMGAAALVAAAVAVAVVLAVSHGGPPPAASQSQSATRSGHAAAAGSPGRVEDAGAVGATFQVTSGSGGQLDVTLTRLIDPARGTDGDSPGKGKRFVAAVFTLTGVRGTPSDDANNAATLIGSNGQTYTASFDTIAGYTNFNSGQFDLSPGQQSVGEVTYQVPAGVKIVAIQWSASDGSGGHPKEWNIR
jgi:serine/threonine protein kinase